MLWVLRRMPPTLVKEMCLTAPGVGALPDSRAIDAWNDQERVCWQKFLRLMRDHYADFHVVSVLEVQERGALHRHVLAVTAAFVNMEIFRSCATAAGYGPRVQLQSAARRMRTGTRGAVSYLTKYITKAMTGFELGARPPITYSWTWTRIAKEEKRRSDRRLVLASKAGRQQWVLSGDYEAWVSGREPEERGYG